MAAEERAHAFDRFWRGQRRPARLGPRPRDREATGGGRRRDGAARGGARAAASAPSSPSPWSRRRRSGRVPSDVVRLAPAGLGSSPRCGKETPSPSASGSSATLDLRLGDAPLPPLESARAESLLAYLLLHRDAPQPRAAPRVPALARLDRGAGADEPAPRAPHPAPRPARTPTASSTSRRGRCGGGRTPRSGSTSPPSRRRSRGRSDDADGGRRAAGGRRALRRRPARGLLRRVAARRARAAARALPRRARAARRAARRAAATMRGRSRYAERLLRHDPLARGGLPAR